ncbi:unnamed protein product [Leuciscus chuanchicus]
MDEIIIKISDLEDKTWACLPHTRGGRLITTWMVMKKRALLCYEGRSSGTNEGVPDHTIEDPRRSLNGSTGAQAGLSHQFVLLFIVIAGAFKERRPTNQTRDIVPSLISFVSISVFSQVTGLR